MVKSLSSLGPHNKSVIKSYLKMIEQDEPDLGPAPQSVEDVKRLFNERRYSLRRLVRISKYLKSSETWFIHVIPCVSIYTHLYH